MKLQFTLLFLIVYLVLASCRLNNSADKVISDIEYAVYRALGSQALVYVGNAGHALAGVAYYVLLVRNKDGAWNVQNLTLAWIS